MIRTKDSEAVSVSTLLDYCDTGESGEAYEIDVQTLPWTKINQLSATANSMRNLTQEWLCSESGDTYNAEAEVSNLKSTSF